MSRLRARSTIMVLAMPLSVTALSLIGLVAGLTGSGWRDALAVVLVALPLLVFLFHLCRVRRARKSRKPAR
ncbi:hypothetical protein OLX02_12705 [Novosphingobium sp. KCTC 2891]|uniref:hypothetical protein n=1 Tax=Novosphingobium sp. KCTC 2891 TaxID=2989730 RepID=UPI002221F957|nr:hypothetical protein [Novosphingobium sp. KCTC 2891]MCW1383682.1 hypothetical protein [Novosphingobium sp. KCTC 2891]